MLSIQEYLQYDGLGLAELVKQKQVTPHELLQAAMQRYEQVNPALGAVVTPMFEQAEQQANTIQTGAFAGVPFLLKDLFQEYAGVPCGQGSRAFQKQPYIPDFNAEIVNRWQATGVNIMGRTNTPELGIKGVTEPQAWGDCHNPWHLRHNSGGSSGGSAAAVAAGITPLAGAGDGGGSIRIPASYCGLFGLKPSRGRTPWGPAFSEAMHGAAIQHVLTRSVRDSAAMLDATHGADLSSLFNIESPQQSYLACLKQPPKRLRIAVNTQSPIGSKVSKDATRAIAHTVKLLQSLGHDVVEDSPAIDGHRLAQDFIVMWFSQCALMLKELTTQFKLSLADFELDTQAAAALGQQTKATEYLSCLNRWGSYTCQLNQFFQHYDVYLTPTTASVAPKNGEVKTPLIQQFLLRGLLKTGQTHHLLKSAFLIDKIVQNNLQWVPFTQLSNITGTPAMSVPLYWNRDGLPLGSQFIAPFGHEHVLLALAAQLEQAQPWQPKYHTMNLL